MRKIARKKREKNKRSVHSEMMTMLMLEYLATIGAPESRVREAFLLLLATLT